MRKRRSAGIANQTLAAGAIVFVANTIGDVFACTVNVPSSLCTTAVRGVIETRRLGFSMLAQAVRFRGTADTMSRVLLTGSYSTYVGAISDAPDEPIAYGEFLRRMHLTKRGGLIIGLRPADEPEIFNPPKEHRVMPGTRLVYIAERPNMEPLS